MRKWEVEEEAAAHCEVRRDRHREYDHEEDRAHVAGGQQAGLDGLGEHDKRKLATGGDVEAAAPGGHLGQAKRHARDKHEGGLAGDKCGERTDDEGHVGEERCEGDLHAGADEEEAEEQAFEGRDVAFHL